MHIINILFNFSEAFKGFQCLDDPHLVHIDHCKMPEGHCTKQYPLWTSTIDESEISSNIAVVNDVYINQLKLSPEVLFNCAIPSINDQSTNACIHGTKALWTKDISPFRLSRYSPRSWLLRNVDADCISMFSRAHQIPSIRPVMMMSWSIWLRHSSQLLSLSRMLISIQPIDQLFSFRTQLEVANYLFLNLNSMFFHWTKVMFLWEPALPLCTTTSFTSPSIDGMLCLSIISFGHDWSLV